MRLIDADALISDMHTKLCDLRNDSYISADYRVGFAFCMEFVKTAPTISPDEARGVGHWVTEQEAIDANDYSLRDTCSVCGRCDWDCTESASFKYCPSCGAKMEVSEDA